MSKERSCIK